MKTIYDDQQEHLNDAIQLLWQARKPVALTGAGISVPSGIPDFRSPGGLWSRFAPEEYASLDTFYRNPAKAWQLYRAMAAVLLGKKPNPAHTALTELEKMGRLLGIITQNIDTLHQQAGSRHVFEIHGEHYHLHCLHCETLLPLTSEHLEPDDIPQCPECAFPLKPNVVLFGESVRDFDAISTFIADCDLLLVIGTSAQVFPAAGLPDLVERNGGVLFEFNHEQVLPQTRIRCSRDHFFFSGDITTTLPMFLKNCKK